MIRVLLCSHVSSGGFEGWVGLCMESGFIHLRPAHTHVPGLQIQQTVLCHRLSLPAGQRLLPLPCWLLPLQCQLLFLPC